jgi:glycosyltransferase involved in cell wall biosynthesis
MHSVKISVIIPTRNRAHVIVKTLDSLAGQVFPLENYEVIVIDNASTDETKKVVDDYMNKISNLKYFYEAKPGLHNGRHRGATEAFGDILAYLDDDVIVSGNWLEGVYEGFQDSSVGIVTGNILPHFEETSPKWLDLQWEECSYGRVLGWLSLMDFGDTMKYIRTDYVCGCNIAVRKDLLMKCNGFHPDSMPNELIRYRGDGETAVVGKIRNLNYKTLFNPKASVFHIIDKNRMTPKYFYRRAFAQGITYSYIQIRAGKNRLLLLFSFCLRMVRIYLSLFLNFKKIHPIKIVLWLYYIAGFLYHQKKVFFDKNLLSWVLKDSYMD